MGHRTNSVKALQETENTKPKVASSDLSSSIIYSIAAFISALQCQYDQDDGWVSVSSGTGSPG